MRAVFRLLGELATFACSTFVSDFLLGATLEATHLVGFFPGHLLLLVIVAVCKTIHFLWKSEQREKITNAVHRITHDPRVDHDFTSSPYIYYAASVIQCLVTGVLIVVACHCVLFVTVTSCYAFTLGNAVVKAWRDVSPNDFPEDFAAHVQQSTLKAFTEFHTITTTMSA